MSVRQGNNIIAIGDVAVDGDTTSFNASNSLQANGVINKNTAVGATEKIYDWVGTLAEYTAQDVATNHPDWLCFITDDQASDFVDFADINASNFTNDGKTFLSAQGMPGTYRESLTILASGSEYTAPANGYWAFHGTLAASSNTNNQILMYERDFLEGNNLTVRLTGNSYQTSFCGILPARAGSKVVVIYASTATNPNWLFFFHYAVGNQGGQ